MLCTETKAVSTSQYLAISIGQLQESPTNPRKTFSDEGLRELADSIKALGGWFSRSSCGRSTLTATRSLQEHDGFGRRSWPTCTKSLRTLWT